jgi:hypothetical protein
MPYIPRELNLVPNTDDDPTFRSSMLPFATYANPDGSGEHFGFAVPGAIQEPVNALMRLFGTPSHPGTFGQGPDAPGNADDMRTLLFSTYAGNALNPAAAIPKGALASGAIRAAEEAPQRMFHGTGVPEDFSTFRPSTSGSFGPGVYLSTDPATADLYAMSGSNPRVLPVDVQGPFATDQQFWTERAKHPDQAATVQALLDQGYNGVQMNEPTFRSNKNVTNVFRPGSVRSATTGETLFSDTGIPSLFGSALSPYTQEPRNSLFTF